MLIKNPEETGIQIPIWSIVANTMLFGARNIGVQF